MRWLVGLLAVFLVVSHTALPGSATAQDFSSAPPQPAAPTVAQSPESREQGSAQIESFSPQGTVKGVRQVTARFSTAMVALGDLRLPDPFRIDCPVKGKGRWMDGQNWVYDFETVLESGVRCQFSLQLALRTLAGQMLSGTRDYRFDTGGPGIRTSLPHAGNVKENQVFILALDGPVATASLLEHVYCLVANSLERVGVEFLTGAARTRFLDQQRQSAPYWYDRLFHPSDKGYQPPLEEEALREAEKTLIVLRCRQPLPSASPVSLVWEAGIASPNGLVTRAEQRLTFKTRPAFTANFQCERIKPHKPCSPSRSMTVAFSEAIPTELAKQVRLLGPEGQAHTADSLAKTSAAQVSSLIFNGPFPANNSFRLEMPPNLTDQDQRPLANATQFPLAITTDDHLPVIQFSGPFRIIPWRKGGGVLPVTLGHVENEITGKKLRIQGNESKLDGQTRQLAHEDFVVLEWLHHVAGSRLGEGFDRTDNRWIEGLARRPVLQSQAETAAESFILRTPDTPQPAEQLAIPLPEPGLYVVELASKRLGEVLADQPQPFYAVTTALVTNLAIHLKHDIHDHVNLVWVTRLDDGQPVQDAAVRINYSCFNLVKKRWEKSRLIWQGATDEEGIARVPDSKDWLGLTPWEREMEKPCYAIVSARSAGDMSFAFPGWTQELPWSFDLNTRWSGRIEHTVLDRTLLRAGETVSMKHFIRHQTARGIEGPADPDPLPSTLRIVHPASGQTDTLPLQIDRQGIGESRWTIPVDAKLGVYEVRLGDSYSETAQFRVEEFRPPTLKVQVRAPAQPLIRPAAVPLTVSINYLNGGGAVGLPITLRTQVKPRVPWFPNYADYFFGDAVISSLLDLTQPEHRAKFMGPQDSANLTQTQSLTLGETGVAQATVMLPPQLNQILDRTPLDLIAEVEYPDANGQWLSAVERIPLWPAAVQLGLRYSTASATVGQPLSLHVAAIDPQGQPNASELRQATPARRLQGQDGSPGHPGLRDCV